MVSALLPASVVLSFGASILGASLEDLPLLDPDVSAWQVSSHNKKGLNGDGGWYLHDGEEEPDTLAGWVDVDAGATAGYTRERRFAGEGALVHTVRLEGLSTGWRSVRKELSEGINLSAFDRVSLRVWPTHADGGIDYAVRIDSGGAANELDIHDLVPGRWNDVVLDLSRTPREGVGAFWLLFNLDWGAADGMRFFVDDISFVAKDGTVFPVDDFERGRRRAVLFDAVGPGSVRAIWGLGGHDIRIEVDGTTVVDAAQDDLFEGRVPGFPAALVRKALVASGPWKCVSHWSFVPVGFTERCRITTRHPSPFYHVIAERYRDPGRAVRWSVDQALPELDLLSTPPGEDPKRWTGLRQERGEARVEAGGFADLLDLEGAGAIGTIRITLPPPARSSLETLWLLMDWDGGAPDVEAPLGFLFGAGVRWQDVPSAALGIRGDEGYFHLPMPFWMSARIRLENRGTKPVTGVGYSITWRPEPYPRARAGHLRAQFHEGPTTRGRDWIFLRAEGRGQYVGVVQRLIGGHYCEGDIRFAIDGSRSPAFYGTGTEDYYHQACWPNADNHTPFHGCVGDVAEEAARAGGGKTFYDFPACYYRLHLEAPVRFESSILCGIEHGGVNDTDSMYASLAFYYVRDRAALAQTDAVAFDGPSVETIESFFEGDDDDVAVKCAILKTKDPVERVLAIDPGNTGVRLRRVLDQAMGPQRAGVAVDGAPAGTWYDPDRNPWKRLAESDLELPPALVRGKTSIKVTFRPQGGPWSIGELRALSHVEGPLLGSRGKERGAPTYTTRFEGTENPLSEGGKWRHDGLDWATIRKDGGHAWGTQTGTNHGASRYDDSYAHLSGFPPDQEAWGEAYIAKPDPSCHQEIEILLRWTSSAHRTTGYECFARCVSDDSAYVQIVRWNGPLGDFTYLADKQGKDYGLKHGDVLEASVIGNVITVSINGVEKARATDDTWKAGDPGIGHFLACDGGHGIGSNGDFGFSSFTARGIESPTPRGQPGAVPGVPPPRVDKTR